MLWAQWRKWQLFKIVILTEFSFSFGGGFEMLQDGGDKLGLREGIDRFAV